MTAFKFDPISKPVSELKKNFYDVVVIGSGYGGGIAASRMARGTKNDGKKLTVCVLERGREVIPDPTLEGGYPKTLAEIQNDTQIETQQGRFGPQTGLYDLRIDDDVCVLVGCGLGGTSLINANVALEATKEVTTSERWPKCFKDNPHILDRYYEMARRWLGSTPYPNPPDYPILPKVEALKASAKAMQQRFRRPPINVTFKDGPNTAGVVQSACVLCGDCVSGCNYGAKNTTLMNYLPDSHRHGAEIFTYANVQYLVRHGDSWRVVIESRETDRDNHRQPEIKTINAGIVILAAGTLGSTEILLRSQAKGLSVSKSNLGKHFSCNGDVVAVGYNNNWVTDDKRPGDNPNSDSTNPVLKMLFQSVLPPGDDRSNINGVGAGDQVLPISQRPGPCIAGIIDMRHKNRLEDALVIEEGVLPGALNVVMPAVSFFADAIEGNFFKYNDITLRLGDAQQLGDAIQNDPSSVQSWSYRGPVARTQTYLLMSYDSANGEIALKNNGAKDKLRVEWKGAGREKVYERDDRALRQANEAIRGEFMPNPLWSAALGKRVITVHPLGGCAMADSGARGVVNDKCQVFCDSSESGQVYENFYVCDGAVVPGALAVNPLLTISAIAERACEKLAEDRGWQIDYSVVAAPLPHPAVSVPSPPAQNCWEKWFYDELRKCFFEDLTEDLNEILGPAVKSEVDRLIAYFERVYKDRESSDDKQTLLTLLLNLVEEFQTGFSPGLIFKERMTGSFSTHVLPHDPVDTDRIADPFEIASKYGAADGKNGQMFAELTIKAGNLYALISDENHEAQITGTVTCEALTGSAKKMRVKHGKFQLLSVDRDKVETWKMVYAMEITGNTGPYHFEGNKIIHQRSGSSWWTDVTTLFVTVYKDHKNGHKTEREIIGRGVLKLGLDDLIKQGSTLRLNRGPILTELKKRLNSWWLQPNWWKLSKEVRQYFQKATVLINGIFAAKFAAFFAKVILQAYGGLLSDLADFPAQEAKARPRRKLRVNPKDLEPEIHTFVTDDRIELQLTRYHGGDAGPVVLAPGFGVTASSFAIDTVPQNIIEYLTEKQFDVWLFDYRASPLLTPRTPPFTIDDIAEHDWPSAIEYIYRATGQFKTIQAIVHCIGSMSFLMALLLNRNAMREKIRSAICSQLTLHPVTGWETHLKSDVNLADILRSQFGITEFDMASSSSLDDKKIDTLLWNLPVPTGQECKNPLCHRVFSVYGPPYDHRQLNAATHIALCDMFGKIRLESLEQIALVVKKEKVVDCKGENVYLTAENAKNLRDLPLTFIAGIRNQLFYSETSARTLAWLREVNEDSYKNGFYDRYVFPDYAHMDFFIGKSAATDIFPCLLEKLMNPEKKLTCDDCTGIVGTASPLAHVYQTGRSTTA